MAKIRTEKADKELSDKVISSDNFVAKNSPQPEAVKYSNDVEVTFLLKAFLHWSTGKTYNAGEDAVISAEDFEILSKTGHVTKKGN